MTTVLRDSISRSSSTASIFFCVGMNPPCFNSATMTLRRDTKSPRQEARAHRHGLPRSSVRLGGPPAFLGLRSVVRTPAVSGSRRYSFPRRRPAFQRLRYAAVYPLSCRKGQSRPQLEPDPWPHRRRERGRGEVLTLSARRPRLHDSVHDARQVLQELVVLEAPL